MGSLCAKLGSMSSTEGTTARRGRRGGDSIYFDHRGSACKDASRPEDKRYHRSCTGRWVGATSTTKNGQRVRRKVSGKTKQAVKDALAILHEKTDRGVWTPADYTVRHCVADWLANGLDGRSAKTVEHAGIVVKPLLALIGDTPLRDLTATDVRDALVTLAKTRSTRTVQIMRNMLVRAITRAEAHDLIHRNVAALAELPTGREGRPSKAMTLDQARALLTASEASPLHAYIVLSLMTGVRPEEARALRWDHVDLDGGQPSMAVWRSVRAHGDTKTEKSRRTLALPAPAAEALRLHQAKQAADREAAAEIWHETGLVFTSTVGTELDAHNVRREFRKVTKAAGLGEKEWTPRELRHSFVSLMSESGVPIEEIARLAGHASTRTTEVVYRKELRPVITTGAEVMGKIFAA